MAFLPFGDRSQRHLKKAMDPRESLHVADLGNANFSAAMSNVDSLEKETVCSGQALDPLKPGNVNVSYRLGMKSWIYRKENKPNLLPINLYVRLES